MRLMRALPSTLLALSLSGCQPSSEAATTALDHLTMDPGQELEPSLSPDGRSVVYSKLTSPGNFDLYLIRDGGVPENLTADYPAGDGQAAFSPDGRSIAFGSAREGGGLYVMNASGGPPRRVIDEGWNPAWSPDGRELYYGSLTAGQTPYASAAGIGGIWAVDVQTGARRQVTATYAFEPDVSPNGQRVAFWALGDGADPLSSGVQRDIWTVSARGGEEPVRVTNDPAVDWSPVWSPEGDYLYFASDRDGTMKVWRVAIDQTTGATTGDAELVSTDQGAPVRGMLSMGRDGTLAYVDRSINRTLYKQPLDPGTGAPGGEPVRLADPAVISPVEFWSSPDGQWLVLRTGDESQEDLYVMRSDGTGLRQLTDDEWRDRTPRWSPDGSRLFFRSDRPLHGERPFVWYQINLDGTGLEPLGFGGPPTVRWSPDGSKALFTEFVSGGGEQVILVDHPDGSGRRALVTSPGDLITPIWSPDGRRIAYREVLDGVGRAYTLDVTAPGAVPEPLPDRDFSPTSWSLDGGAIAGDEVVPDGPNRTLVFDFGTGRFEQVTDASAGPVWFEDGRHLLVSRDAGRTVEVVDRETKGVLGLTSVAAPTALAFGLSRDNSALFYVVSEIEADVYRMRLP